MARVAQLADNGRRPARARKPHTCDAPHRERSARESRCRWARRYHTHPVLGQRRTGVGHQSANRRDGTSACAIIDAA
jgi:hypothetical protein